MSKKNDTPEIRYVMNYAYPIIKAICREEASLEPNETWNGEMKVEEEGGETWLYRVPYHVCQNDIEFLMSLNWYENDDIVMEALERSAYLLGLEWSNEKQTLVPYGKGDSCACLFE